MYVLVWVNYSEGRGKGLYHLLHKKYSVEYFGDRATISADGILAALLVSDLF